MGIRSTQDISRTVATKRIHEVATIISSKHYKNLESAGFEDCPPSSVIDDPEELALAKRILEADLDSWTNKMIEDVLDRPFYRSSMFENYLIREQ